jgi:hypothetical protein
MNKTITTLTAALFLFAANSISLAQDLSLKGASALELNIGMWAGAKSSTTVAVGGIRSEAKANGFNASLLYTHWLREYLSLTLSAGFLAGEASSTSGMFGFNQQASAVVPFLLGLRYYLPKPGPDDAVRPFLSAAIGMYVGMEAKNTVLVQEARSEAVLGGRVGGGIDFLLGNHFKLGANIGYNLASDFSTPIGARTNSNGADFSFGFGYIF